MKNSYPFYQKSTGTYPQKLLEVVNITIDSDLCGLYNIEPVKLKKILYMLRSTPTGGIEQIEAQQRSRNLLADALKIPGAYAGRGQYKEF